MVVMNRLPAVDREKASPRPLTRELFSRSKLTRTQFFTWWMSLFICQKYHLIMKSAVLTMKSAVLTMKSAVFVDQWKVRPGRHWPGCTFLPGRRCWRPLYCLFHHDLQYTHRGDTCLFTSSASIIQHFLSTEG